MVERIKRKTINLLFPRDTHSELPLDPDALHPGEYKYPLQFVPGLQLIVFLGGCLGTFARYEIEVILPDTSSSIPYGTLFINLCGAFLLGLLLEELAQRGEDRGKIQQIRLGLGTGFIAAFTTYSTLAVEAAFLAHHRHVELALLYAVTSVIGGLAFCTAGIILAGSRNKETVR